MKITDETSLSDLAFIVCTTLQNAGTTDVLSGGGAATVHSANTYQSHDLDFIFSFWSALRQPSAAPLVSLGFEELNGTYRHKETAFSVEFPPGPLAIGDDPVTSWQTLHKGPFLLHILSPTDSVRDRLAWFIFNNDYSALEQALSVARRNTIDLDLVQRWCAEEGGQEKFEIFRHRYLMNELPTEFFLT